MALVAPWWRQGPRGVVLEDWTDGLKAKRMGKQLPNPSVTRRLFPTMQPMEGDGVEWCADWG